MAGAHINSVVMQPHPSGNPLSVDDIERLAKAGVKMEFKDFAHLLCRDDAFPRSETTFQQPPLVQSFWDRWRRANPPSVSSFGEVMPWGIYATPYGDKVYVFVSPTDAPPFILEDDGFLYPSDALMAKLHLREQTK